jgi:hypothetical protein
MKSPRKPPAKALESADRGRQGAGTPEPYRDLTPKTCPHCGATAEQWLYQFHLNAKHPGRRR